MSYTDYKGDRVPVFSFVEGEGQAFWGGCKKLRELAAAWEEELGDLREVNSELQVEGVKIKLSPTIRTKGGNPFRPVAVLGTVKFSECEDVEPEEVAPDCNDDGEVADTFSAPF